MATKLLFLGQNEKISPPQWPEAENEWEDSIWTNKSAQKQTNFTVVDEAQNYVKITFFWRTMKNIAIVEFGPSRGKYA